MNHLKKLNLPQFILSGGWGYKTSQKSCKNWVVLENGQNKLLIKNAPNKQGHWIFKDLNSEKSGSIIDFLILEGFNFKQIKQQYGNISFDPSPSFSPTCKNSKPSPKPLNLGQIRKKLVTFWHTPKNNYLLERGISIDLINDYLSQKDVNFETAKTNVYGAMFPLFLAVSADLQGILVGVARYNSKKDKHAPNQKRVYGQKGLCVLKQNGPFNSLFICESAVDALSLETLHRKHKIAGKRAYIATCGRISGQQLKCLKILLPQLKQKITIAMDGDEAGQKAAIEIKNVVNLPISVKTPKKGKDWNDVLGKTQKIQ